MISKSTVTDNPHFAPFLEAITQMSQRGRVYNIYVSGPTHLEEFTFRTTNRDVHLKLGMLDFQSQLNFARMLEWHFANCVEGATQILLFKEGADDGLLITRTKENSQTIFTLSPAN